MVSVDAQSASEFTRSLAPDARQKQAGLRYTTLCTSCTVYTTVAGEWEEVAVRGDAHGARMAQTVGGGEGCRGDRARQAWLVQRVGE